MESIVLNIIPRSDISRGDRNDEVEDRPSSDGSNNNLDRCDDDRNSLSADGFLSDVDNTVGLLMNHVRLNVAHSSDSSQELGLAGHLIDNPQQGPTTTNEPGVREQLSSPNGTAPSGIAGSSRCKLLHEGDIQLCRLNHTRTIVSKIMNSKYLRRWESHHLVLDNCEIRSLTQNGFMESSIPYSSIEEVNVISRWDAGQRFCIRITVPDGSVLLQNPNTTENSVDCMLAYDLVMLFIRPLPSRTLTAFQLHGRPSVQCNLKDSVTDRLRKA